MLHRNLQPSSSHPPRGKGILSSLVRPAALLGCAFITLGDVASFAAEGPSLKELAGPPSDFGWMQLPDPADHAVGSKTHLIPVELAADGSWSREIHVDPDGDFKLTVVGPAGWQLDLQTPEGRWLGKSAAWKQAGLEGLGLGPAEKRSTPDAEVTPGESLKTWSFNGPSEGGSWRLQVQAPEGSQGSDPTAGFVVVTDQSPWSLSLWSSRLDTVVGQPIILQAALRRDLAADLEGDLEGAVKTQGQPGFDVVVDQLELTATAADGSRRSWSRTDGNLDAVLIASAGSAKSAQTAGLSFQVMPEMAGEHRFDLRLKALDDQGQLIERTTSVWVQVIQPPLALIAQDRTVSLRAADQDPSKVADSTQRLQIDLPVSRLELNRGGLEQAMVYAELWGHDAAGLPLPVAWVGGIKNAEDTAEGLVLPIRLDSRWLAKAGARPPYRLQNLRLVDVDSSVPFAAAAELPLEITAPTSWVYPAKRLDLEPDEAMLFGPRPLDLHGPPAAAAKSTPRETIVLVHGYCSGNVWSAYQNPFVQPRRIFADFGQARSNNQFAVELWWQTNSIDHFSTVSHSQGGMASLHLYNYYWSGLDTSLAPRPMQSVGTPFNGSTLMNHRAALDTIIDLLNLEDRFCPVVTELTHFGAAIWQAGISSASRNKAYYYRTRGTLLPCHALTSAIILGRDDGVVSLQEGELSGGHDLGITNAQCHTPDMTHPFQLSDANRNVQMAANARIWIPDPIEACATVTPTQPYVPALTLLNASCSTVQSGSIVQYRWDIDRPVGSDLTLYGQNISTTFTAAGIYHITLTITSTGPTLTDTATRFVLLSDPGDPL